MKNQNSCDYSVYYFVFLDWPYAGHVDRDSSTRHSLAEVMAMAEAEPSHKGQGHHRKTAKVRKNYGINALAAKFLDENVPFKKKVRQLITLYYLSSLKFYANLKFLSKEFSCYWRN